MTEWACNQVVRDEGFGETECGEAAEYKNADGQPRCFFHTPRSGRYPLLAHQPMCESKQNRICTCEEDYSGYEVVNGPPLEENIHERSERRAEAVTRWDGGER